MLVVRRVCDLQLCEIRCYMVSVFLPKSNMTPYTPVHYFLLGLSAFAFASFFGGLAYLLIREQHKGTEAKKQQWKNLLQKRRKAISGRPRHPATSFSENSTEEWQMSSSYSSPQTDTLENSETQVTICS